jgi:tetratricopeptide (TPR) repeat protein
MSRPARDLISVLSYPKAIAWIIARLAEALDFAFSRGVLHGDVKPSNILLTADCTPMLLDFNLAVYWQPYTYGPGAKKVEPDHGGTLAYMAPERLRSVADVAFAPRPSAAERHRGDVYGLGVVLLEALTGRTPEITTGRGGSLQQMASAYVSSRERGGEVMIRATRAPIPAGIRSILEHCLAPDPADRYKRAAELAEDLDRWRADLPLAYSREPGAGLGVLRWLRRQRGAVAAGLIGTAVAGGCAALTAYAISSVRHEYAASGYSQLEGSAESGAFKLRRPVSNVVKAKADPAELAKRHLEHYGILASANWKQRGDSRDLTGFEREELEVWLLEQAMRFAQALSERPDSPDDWRRALLCLERVDPVAQFAPIAVQTRELRRLLGISHPLNESREAAPAPRWMGTFLEALELELSGHEREALPRYLSVLAVRPASFWANYRAAAMAFLLGDYDLAAKHLERCVAQRPKNPILRNQYAGCLYWSHRLDEALEQGKIAQELDPDQAETFLSRSYVRLKLGQAQSLFEDLTRFEILNGRNGRSYSKPSRIDLVRAARAESDEFPDGSRKREDLGPDEVHVGHELGMLLWQQGHHSAALTEFDRVLEMDPDNIPARYGRGSLLKVFGRDGSDKEFAAVVAHPNVEAWLKKDSRYLFAFFTSVSSLIEKGNTQDAVGTAKRAVELAEKLGEYRAEAHLVLARAFVACSEADTSLYKEAARELETAYHFDPKQAPDWLNNPIFEEVRLRFGPMPFEKP